MKKIIAVVILICVATYSFGQLTANEMLTELGKLQDQYGKSFDPAAVKDKLIVVYIPGADDPFIKVYDKLKGKSLKDNSNVQFVGGFKEMMAGGGNHGSGSGVINHVREAFVSKYGERHFSILIDLESVLAGKMGIKGNTIIEISKKTNKIERVTDYSQDRKKFLDTIANYFN